MLKGYNNKDDQGKVSGLVCISNDITDRKKVEETLYNERNQLRTLIDNLPDLIFFKDIDGRYILNNIAHLKSIGASKQEEVIGKTTFDFNPPELAKQYHEDEIRIIESGEAMIGKEEIAFHQDIGKMRWHLTSKIPLKDVQGKVTGLVCISSDITERKQVEETLNHERNQLRTLIDNLPDLIFFKDIDGRYILNNIAHLKSIGASKQEEVIGKTTFDYNPPEMAKQYHEDEMQIVQTGKALLNKIETAKHSDTGEIRWHLTSKIPLFDNQKKVTGIVGIARDITEQKRAEEERERLLTELQKTLNEVKTLRGLLPICASCKKIRDDKGFWNQVEAYIQERSDARFSHSICPDCINKLYPQYSYKKEKNG